MKVELLAARELSADLLARWHVIQSQTAALASPYFRPEFVQAVAALRDNVEVAVLSNGGCVCGFFPFERVRRTTARPVGQRLSDYQGVVAAADCQWQVSEILRGCRLGAWEFDHQLACQQQLAPAMLAISQSPQLELSAGFPAWLEERRAAKKMMGECVRKLRKLEREHAVRFEWHTTDEAVFQQLLAWKSEQYARTGLDDLFATGWIVSLLRGIWQSQQPRFAGVLSALYVNEKLAGVHFSMQSGGMLHSWFPAYDVGLGKYSPGACLLLKMAEHAAKHGVTCIDLGKGDEEYKLAFGNQSVSIGEGAVDSRRLSSALRSSWRTARDWVKQTPLKAPAKASLRLLRSVQTWMGVAP